MNQGLRESMLGLAAHLLHSQALVWGQSMGMRTRTPGNSGSSTAGQYYQNLRYGIMNFSRYFAAPQP